MLFICFSGPPLVTEMSAAAPCFVFTRDLVVNNDHIHVVEQRMRAAIDQGLSQR